MDCRPFDRNRYQVALMKIMSYVFWQVSLLPEKKDTVVCLAGARSLFRPEKKRYSRLSGGCAIIITTGKKKDTVVCLAGARSCLSFLSQSLYLY